MARPACAHLTHPGIEGAKNLLGTALGWSFEASPMPTFTYWIIKKGDERIGGIFDLNSDERCKGCWSIGSLISPSMTSMRASRPRWRPPLPRREPPPSS